MTATSSPSSVRTGGRKTAFEHVKEGLRERILAGDLKGGTHLTQVDVAREMGVSTTPVREAFRQLASEGLFTLDAHRGAVVRQTNLEDAEEIFMMRRMLEPHATRLSARRITEREIESVRSWHQSMVAASGVSEWFSYNRSFHREILSAARSPRLVSTLHALLDSTSVYLGLSLRTVDKPFQIGHSDHAKILHALETRDEAAIAVVVLEHLEHTEQRVRAALESDGTV